MGHGTPLVPPLAALDPGEYQHPCGDHAGRSPPAELQEGAFPPAAPASEGHAGPERQQKAGAMVEPVGERQPVIDSQEGQQKDKRPNCRKARHEAGSHAHDEGQGKKENGIHQRRNPENLFGDVHHRTPTGPIDSLKHEQEGGFRQAGGNSPAQANQKDPACAGWNCPDRRDFLIPTHCPLLAGYLHDLPEVWLQSSSRTRVELSRMLK